MAIDQSTRMKVEGELRLGKQSKELSEKYGIPYITIRGWAKKIEAMQADEDVDKLLEYDEVTLHTMVEDLSVMPNNLALESDLALKDYREAAGIVSTLHTALFSKNTTQVNVLNNNTISNERRDIFKSSLGA